jgi:prolyl-tRNA synthetase
MASLVVGGNALDVHFTGVVPGRDFPLANVHDLRNAASGDPCPRCGKPLVESQGIEIGHVFKLGTKYSKAMNATFLDEKGASHDVIMGCYGIGVNRILASAVEAFHDANGIAWPLALAPYGVAIVVMPAKDPARHAEIDRLAQSLAAELEAAGVDVLIDDRDQRPGVKFKDVDLIGIPLRIVIGERGLKEGTLEVKWRDQAEPHTVPADSGAAAILSEWKTRQDAEASRLLDRQVARATRRGVLIAGGGS